jgi:hypothetical protein
MGKSMTPLTYVFCVVRSARAPRVAGLRGLPGSAPVRALDAGRGLWLVVASVPEAQFGEAALEQQLGDLDWVGAIALAHDRVVGKFLGKAAPARLLTLFRSDERAIEDVRKRAREVTRLLDRLDGRVEWGVRLTLDEQAALRRATAGVERGPLSSGAAFLQRKKRLRDVQRDLELDARKQADALFESLAAAAADARRRPPLTEEAAARLLLDAAYLVPSSRGKRFRAEAQKHERRLGAAGYTLTLSGPFAPYNFVS